MEDPHGVSLFGKVKLVSDGTLKDWFTQYTGGFMFMGMDDAVNKVGPQGPVGDQ